jgi:hypothetical protein
VSVRPILAHLCKVAFPDVGAKEFWKALNTPYAQNLLQCRVDSRGIGLDAQYASGLFKQLRIEHKVCTFHVYGIPPGSCCLVALCRRGSRLNVETLLHREGMTSTKLLQPRVVIRWRDSAADLRGFDFSGDYQTSFGDLLRIAVSGRSCSFVIVIADQGTRCAPMSVSYARSGGSYETSPGTYYLVDKLLIKVVPY